MQSVSIVTCSHNGTTRLPALLASLKELTVRSALRLELVFVDSASVDTTADLVDGWDLPFPVKVCQLTEPGQSRALNKAIELAEGELLLFTDDDCRVAPDWLCAYADAATAVPEAGYLFGPVVPLLTETLPDWWDLAPRSLRGRSQGEELRVYRSFGRDSYPMGCNMAVPRRALAGGLRFEEKLGPSPDSPTSLGADTKLGRSLQHAGFAGCYVPNALVYHSVHSSRVSWGYLVSHFWASGRCSLYYKPVDTPAGRFRFASSCLRKCLCWSVILAVQLVLRRRLAAKKTRLSLMKASGAVWEYVSTCGGRLG